MVLLEAIFDLFKLLAIEPLVKRLPYPKQDIYTSVSWMTLPVLLFVFSGLLSPSVSLAMGVLLVSVTVVVVFLFGRFRIKGGYKLRDIVFLIIVPPVVVFGLLVLVGVMLMYLIPLLFKVVNKLY